MRIKRIAFAGAALMAALMAGCGTRSIETAPTEVTESPSPTPVPEVTAATAPEGVLVNMEKVEEPEEIDAENTIGEKTESSSSVLIINQTGDPIDHIFIRAAARDDGSSDEWGAELIHTFDWPNEESAIYYYENNQIDLEGSTATSYDIRISYEDENKSELYYRNLPLPLMKEIRLCVDISGDFGVPYARYITISGNREFSTLQEVRAWYGLDVEETEYEESETETTEYYDDVTSTTYTDEVTPTPEAAESTTEAYTEASTTEPTTTATTAETVTEAATTTTTAVEYTTPASEESYDEPDPDASTAQGYLGQSLSSLIGAMGSPSGSEYSDEPGAGRAGYHYYGTFTVSTSVDDDGNETITGIW